MTPLVDAKTQRRLGGRAALNKLRRLYGESYEENYDWLPKLYTGTESRDGYPTFEESNALLEDWLRKYPDYLKKEKIGTSLQGRDLYTYILANHTSFG